MGSEKELAMAMEGNVKGCPMNWQQVANNELDKWSEEWAVGDDYDLPQWPKDCFGKMQKLSIQRLKEAAKTFPNETGLGWDGIHPKASKAPKRYPI